ncbi:hypothetical protein D3C71_1457180 [compost metagenome]
MKTSGSAAASRMVRFVGLGASRSASTVTKVASEPWRPPTPPVKPNTSSCGLNAVTPGPTASTTPATSMPRMAGSGWRAWGAWPLLILRSSGLTLLALTRTRTWPAAGAGQTIVVRTRSVLVSFRTRASMVVALVVIGVPFMRCRRLSGDTQNMAERPALRPVNRGEILWPIGSRRRGRGQDISAKRVLAATKSAVSKPSLNRLYTDANAACARAVSP